MTFEFSIPTSRDDLQKRSHVDAYVVDEVFPARLLHNKLQEFKSAFRSRGPQIILAHFDTFFSILKHFSVPQVGPEVKEDAWGFLVKGLDTLCSRLVELFDGEIDPDTRRDYRNALKMYAYLLCQMIELMESTAAPVILLQGGRGRKKKAATADNDNAWWQDSYDRGIRAFLMTFNLSIQRLWDPPVVEDECISLITNSCYKLLENANVCKDKASRDFIFDLLGVMVKKYNHGLGCSLKMVQLLQHFDHLVSPLASAVEMFVNKYGVKSVAADMMREIGRLEPEVLSCDTSGTRAYAGFLVELAEKVPAVVLPNISVILDFTDEESYTMCNCVLSVLGEMVIRMLSKEDLDDKQKELRDEFLDILEDHIHDVNAFVRSRSLSVWLKIVNEKALPMTRQNKLLELVIGRLEDVSCQVRKHAIQLLTAILGSNPLTAKMTYEDLKTNYEQEKEKLKEMTPKPPEPEPEPPSKEQSEDGDSDTEKGEADGEEKEKPDLLAVVEEAEATVLPDDTQPTVVNELTKQQVLVTFLKSSMNFAKHIQAAVPIITVLLASKNVTETLEAINFFVTGFELGAANMMMGIRRMLVLIWSREQQVKEAIVDAYRQLYLTPTDGSAKANAMAVANNLIALASGATMGDMESLEAVICEFIKTGDLTDQVIQTLWQRFTLKIPNTTAYDSRIAVRLLGMAATANVNIVRKNIDVLVKEGLGPRAEEDFQLARDTISVMIKLAGAQKERGATASESFRLPQDHEMFERLSFLILTGVSKLEQSHWIPMVEVAIQVIYGLAEHPDDICQKLIKQVAAEIGLNSPAEPPSQKPVEPSAGEADKPDEEVPPEGQQSEGAATEPPEPTDAANESPEPTDAATESQEPTDAEDPIPPAQENVLMCSPALLARFCTLLGNCAQRQLVHLEVSILGEFKRRQAIEEEAKSSDQKKRKSSIGGDKSKDKGDEMTIEEEMGLTGATADDMEAEYIRRLTETEIVDGGNLLAYFAPLLVEICGNSSKYKDEGLRSAATLALAKHMLVSSIFCEEHLQLLFTVLEKSPHPVIRSNLIIALGDLTFRFPNLIEPWTPNLYARLHDESPKVRQNTLKVLTHLILNDMVKVKGQISELATCIVDENTMIANLSKLFFHELAKKGNAIYNIMPDMVSRLSDPQIGVSEEHFHTIMIYLFEFIQKERQCESLVEKLCHRFRATRIERQWRDLAFCLSRLSFNEKSLRKLQENISCYANTLHDPQVYEAFETILSSSKAFAKPETKVMVEELAEQLKEFHTKGMDEEEVAQKASKASAAVKSRKGSRTPGKTAAKTPATQRVPKKKKAKLTFSSDEEESEPEPEAPPVKSSPSKPSDEENADPNSTKSPEMIIGKKSRHKSVSSRRAAVEEDDSPPRRGRRKTSRKH